MSRSKRRRDKRTDANTNKNRNIFTPTLSTNTNSAIVEDEDEDEVIDSSGFEVDEADNITNLDSKRHRAAAPTFAATPTLWLQTPLGDNTSQDESQSNGAENVPS